MMVGAFAVLVAVTAAAPYSLSVDNRVGKKMYMAAEVSSYASLPALGVRAGWFLGPDAVLSIGQTRMNATQAGETHSGNATEIGYKSFFTNSLYAEAGFHHQIWSVFGKDYARSATTLHVGNQWQRRSATAGCDWLGYMLPVAGTAPVANDVTARFRVIRAYAGYSF